MGEEDKKSSLWLIDVSIFLRKEMHLPDHNHFGKLHFNAESSAQRELVMPLWKINCTALLAKSLCLKWFERNLIHTRNCSLCSYFKRKKKHWIQWFGKISLHCKYLHGSNVCVNIWLALYSQKFCTWWSHR